MHHDIGFVDDLNQIDNGPTNGIHPGYRPGYSATRKGDRHLFILHLPAAVFPCGNTAFNIPGADVFFCQPLRNEFAYGPATDTVKDHFMPTLIDCIRISPDCADFKRFQIVMEDFGHASAQTGLSRPIIMGITHDKPG